MPDIYHDTKNCKNFKFCSYTHAYTDVASPDGDYAVTSVMHGDTLVAVKVQKPLKPYDKAKNPMVRTNKKLQRGF